MEGFNDALTTGELILKSHTKGSQHIRLQQQKKAQEREAYFIRK